ncbi:hypothetical protein ACFO4O_04460 [Glaciecola siphonariae]|uniref:Lipoprotein n=1 Tax=Glaciecola siphonariae TaxID=521012 RepID=A0ABV9LSF0_9ALTE
MMNRFLLVVLIFSIVGCSSGPTDEAVEVMWHGGAPARQYSFEFLDINKSPLSGVSFKCFGDEGSIAAYVASDLNQSSTISDKFGALTISHQGFQTHGTYMQKGNERWAFTTLELPRCEFYYLGDTVFSGNLKSFNTKELVVVSE